MDCSASRHETIGRTGHRLKRSCRLSRAGSSPGHRGHMGKHEESARETLWRTMTKFLQQINGKQERRG